MATRVLVAKPGLDGHDRGAKIVARLLRDAGYEVIYTGIRATADQIAAIAVQEDVDLIGLSVLSGAHIALTGKVSRALARRGAAGIPIIVGGTIGEQDQPKLRSAGAQAVFPTGTSSADILRGVAEVLRMADGAVPPPRSDPPAMPSAELITAPLAGIRVLDFSHFLAGPYATWILAELGADVIKVEDPDHPDEARGVGPHYLGEQSLYFAALNGGKRSCVLRLGTPEGRATAHRLAATADVVVSNSRPGVLAKLGLGPDVLAALNPRLITCSLTGYGETGGYSSRPGYDYTIQALAGVMSMTGEPDGPPGKAGISYVDHSGGLAAALAVCGGLVSRARTNRGGHIDLALLDIQVSMLTYLAAWHLNTGWVGTRTPAGSHPSIVPAQNFRTGDGYVALFVGNDGIWRRLVAALGDADLTVRRYATGDGRREHRVPLLARLSVLLLEHGSDHWVELLSGAGVPCERINDLPQALADEQVAARGMVRTSDSPYGSYRFIGGPLPRMGRSVRPAPLLGEHTDEILAELGSRTMAAQPH